MYATINFPVTFEDIVFFHCQRTSTVLQAIDAVKSPATDSQYCHFRIIFQYLQHLASYGVWWGFVDGSGVIVVMIMSTTSPLSLLCCWCSLDISILYTISLLQFPRFLFEFELVEESNSPICENFCKSSKTGRKFNKLLFSMSAFGTAYDILFG